MTEGFSPFESIGEARSDTIWTEGFDLISEWSHEKSKRSKVEESLVEMALSFSEVWSFVEEEESEGFSFVKESLLSSCESKASFSLLWLLKILLLHLSNSLC